MAAGERDMLPVCGLAAVGWSRLSKEAAMLCPASGQRRAPLDICLASWRIVMLNLSQPLPFCPPLIRSPTCGRPVAPTPALAAPATCSTWWVKPAWAACRSSTCRA